MTVHPINIHNHFPQRLLSRCGSIQNDVAEGQGDTAGAFGFDAIDHIGFSGGDGVLPFIAGGAGEDDQAAFFENDGFFSPVFRLENSMTQREPKLNDAIVSAKQGTQSM